MHAYLAKKQERSKSEFCYVMKYTQMQKNITEKILNLKCYIFLIFRLIFMIFFYQTVSKYIGFES